MDAPTTLYTNILTQLQRENKVDENSEVLALWTKERFDTVQFGKISCLFHAKVIRILENGRIQVKWMYAPGTWQTEPDNIFQCSSHNINILKTLRAAVEEKHAPEEAEMKEESKVSNVAKLRDLPFKVISTSNDDLMNLSTLTLELREHSASIRFDWDSLSHNSNLTHLSIDSDYVIEEAELFTLFNAVGKQLLKFELKLTPKNYYSKQWRGLSVISRFSNLHDLSINASFHVTSDPWFEAISNINLIEAHPHFQEVLQKLFTRFCDNKKSKVMDYKQFAALYMKLKGTNQNQKKVFDKYARNKRLEMKQLSNFLLSSEFNGVGRPSKELLKLLKEHDYNPNLIPSQKEYSLTDLEQCTSLNLHCSTSADLYPSIGKMANLKYLELVNPEPDLAALLSSKSMCDLSLYGNIESRYGYYRQNVENNIPNASIQRIYYALTGKDGWFSTLFNFVKRCSGLANLSINLQNMVPLKQDVPDNKNSYRSTDIIINEKLLLELCYSLPSTVQSIEILHWTEAYNSNLIQLSQPNLSLLSEFCNNVSNMKIKVDSALLEKLAAIMENRCVNNPKFQFFNDYLYDDIICCIFPFFDMKTLCSQYGLRILNKRFNALLNIAKGWRHVTPCIKRKYFYDGEDEISQWTLATANGLRFVRCLKLTSEKLSGSESLIMLLDRICESIPQLTVLELVMHLDQDGHNTDDSTKFNPFREFIKAFNSITKLTKLTTLRLTFDAVIPTEILDIIALHGQIACLHLKATYIPSIRHLEILQRLKQLQGLELSYESEEHARRSKSPEVKDVIEYAERAVNCFTHFSQLTSVQLACDSNNSGLKLLESCCMYCRQLNSVDIHLIQQSKSEIDLRCLASVKSLLSLSVRIDTVDYNDEFPTLLFNALPQLEDLSCSFKPIYSTDRNVPLIMHQIVGLLNHSAGIKSFKLNGLSSRYSSDGFLLDMKTLLELLQTGFGHSSNLIKGGTIQLQLALAKAPTDDFNSCFYCLDHNYTSTFLNLYEHPKYITISFLLDRQLQQQILRSCV